MHLQPLGGGAGSPLRRDEPCTVYTLISENSDIHTVG